MKVKSYINFLYIFALFIFSVLIISLFYKGKANAPIPSNSKAQERPETGSNLFPTPELQNLDVIEGRYIIKISSDAADDVERLTPNNNRILDLSTSEVASDAVGDAAPLITKLQQLGIEKFERLPFSIQGNSYLVATMGDKGKNNDSFVTTLSQTQGVEHVEPDYLFKPLEITDPYFLDKTPSAEERTMSIEDGGWDPEFEYQYGLKNIRFNENSLNIYFNGNFMKNAPPTVIAVIDSGIDYNHEDLRSMVWENYGEMGLDILLEDKKENKFDDDNNGYEDDWRGWNAVNLVPYGGIRYDPNQGSIVPNEIEVTPNNDPFDKAFEEASIKNHPYGGGHGTHVSGIIAASLNGYGIVGVNPKAKIMPLRVCSAAVRNPLAGLISFCLQSNILKMIMYAVDNGAQVINISLGTTYESEALHDAIHYALDNNVTVVAAAGNGYGNPVLNPAAYEGVIAVSAVNSRDEFEQFSSVGEEIDVSAPGKDIISARSSNVDPFCRDFRGYDDCLIGVRTGPTIKGKEKKFLIASGTSMAAPHVAGLASLVIAKNAFLNQPPLTPKEIANIIANGADDLGTPDFDKYYGFGRVNIQNTLLTMDKSDVSRATQELTWEINTKLACPNGSKPWLPLPESAQIYIDVRSEDYSVNKNIVSSFFRNDERKITINAAKKVDQYTSIAYLMYYWPMSVQLPPPHPSMIFLRFESTPSRYIQPWPFKYYSLRWVNAELPSGKYSLTFNPYPDSGLCKDQTWNIETNLTCENGNIPESHFNQPAYMILAKNENNKFEWQFGLNEDSTSKSFSVISSSGEKDIFVGIRDQTGKMFPLIGEPQNLKIKYDNAFGKGEYSVAYWKGSELFDYAETIKLWFKAPDTWCDNDPSTPNGPQPTTHPSDGTSLPQVSDLELLQQETPTRNHTDLNDDGVTNSLDIFIVIENYSSLNALQSTGNEAITGDINGDNNVDALDLSTVISQYGLEK